MSLEHTSQDMIDRHKRTILKAIAATGAVAAVPALASVALAAGGAGVLEPSLDGAGLTVHFTTVLADGRRRVQLRNHSTVMVMVQHVYPGRVTVDGTTFDLNDLFGAGGLAVAPDSTLDGTLTPASPAGSERALPARLSHSRPVRVSSFVARADGMRPVTTTRSLFA